jgi:uncharacterized cupredoxin-like copper-binding protein
MRGRPEGRSGERPVLADAAGRMRHHVREGTMTRNRFGLFALGALAAVGTFVAIATHPVAAQASTHLTFTLNEFAIAGDALEVPAGEVSFDVSNTGEDLHELIVFKSDLDVTALPMSAAVKNEVDESQVGEYIGGFEDVAAGATANGTLMLAPGRYILLCNLSKHYEAGMVSTLQVN